MTKPSESTTHTLLSDEQAIDLALTYARRGVRGANPLVGAVITDNRGRLLQTGWHRGAGTAHAEADAIAKARGAGIDLTGATIYVTLEPCNHTGRTGPCSRAVLEAGISRLVYAHRDETADAAGGADFLAARGLEVIYQPTPAAAELNRRWFEAAGRRPFITAKIASSLDGVIAAADGTSQWITGAEARQDGHVLRTRVDAILIGTQTAILDDPQLTARTANGELARQQPLRVVMGERDLPSHLLIAQAISRGENALQLKTYNPQKVAEELYRCGVRHLMIEGGPTTLAGFLETDLVDEIRWYQAPLLLGAGRRAVSDIGVQTLFDAQRWVFDELETDPAVLRLGADVRLRLIPAAPQN